MHMLNRKYRQLMAEVSLREVNKPNTWIEIQGMQTTPYIPKTQKKETFASRVKEAGLLPEKIGQ